MSADTTAGSTRLDEERVTAAEWFAGGQRLWYDSAAARERVPEPEILTFPGGHLTTIEHPDLLAAIRDIAESHGVGSPAAIR